MSILVGLGFDLLISRPSRRILGWAVFVFAMLPIPTYIIAPVVAEEAGFNISTRADIPYRNDYRWFLRPWRTGYTGADDFADEVFKELEPDAVVYADNTMVYPLLYMQEVKGRRTDIRIISDHASSEGLPVLSEKSIEQWLSEGVVHAVSPVAGHKGRGIVWKIVD